MNLIRVFVALSLPLAASAQWAPSVAKCEADARTKRRVALILVWEKGNADSDRLEKELWSVEPVKSVLRDLVGVKVEKAAPADPKTLAAAPHWKAQADGAPVAPELRLIHPWGKERLRIPGPRTCPRHAVDSRGFPRY